MLQLHKRDLQQQYKVKSIAIFGSYIRGQQNEESDLDILVEFTSPVSLLHIVSLENHLTDILDVQVDVIPRKSIREELRGTILREAVPL
jgi:hypothetical protein